MITISHSSYDFKNEIIQKEIDKFLSSKAVRNHISNYSFEDDILIITLCNDSVQFIAKLFMGIGLATAIGIAHEDR
jgi:superfamily I DNA and/or RNA helicase